MPFRRGCSALTLSLGAGEREEPFRVGDFLRDALLLDILLFGGLRGFEVVQEVEVDFSLVI